mgnify:CR=1 FL=1
MSDVVVISIALGFNAFDIITGLIKAVISSEMDYLKRLGLFYVIY